MANIAEGFERGGRREFVHFLSVAGGSLGELRSHWYVALDAGFVSEEVFRQVQEQAIGVGRIVGGLRRRLLTSSVPGRTFREGK